MAHAKPRSRKAKQRTARSASNPKSSEEKPLRGTVSARLRAFAPLREPILLLLRARAIHLNRRHRARTFQRQRIGPLPIVIAGIIQPRHQEPPPHPLPALEAQLIIAQHAGQRIAFQPHFGPRPAHQPAPPPLPSGPPRARRAGEGPAPPRGPAAPPPAGQQPPPAAAILAGDVHRL